MHVAFHSRILHLFEERKPKGALSNQCSREAPFLEGRKLALRRRQHSCHPLDGVPAERLQIDALSSVEADQGSDPGVIDAVFNSAKTISSTMEPQYEQAKNPADGEQIAHELSSDTPATRPP